VQKKHTPSISKKKKSREKNISERNVEIPGKACGAQRENNKYLLSHHAV
jgi:hypothetical protein